MSHIRSTVDIDAPVEAVFDFIDYWPNAMRYLRRMVRWEPVDPKETGVGAVLRVGVQAGPTRLDGKLRVTEHERPRTIAFRSIDGPRVEGAWLLSAKDGATHVVLDASYDLPGGLVGRLVSNFVSRNAQNDLDSSLRDLKRLVEESAAQ